MKCMARLKSRQMQIPNGYRFVQPETNWQPRRFSSFDSIVTSLISHRKGRPDLVAKHHWSTDYDVVAEEVERFNVNLCQRQGWNNYLDEADFGGGAPPKQMPLSQADQRQVSAAAGRVTKIWAGVKTLNEWIDSGETPVAAEVANQRASVCAVCPRNGSGDFTTWFTKPAAAAIQRQMEKLQERKLSTPDDDKINICEVCLCPLKLKTHTPFKFIAAHLTDQVYDELPRDPMCWMVAEAMAFKK